MFHLNLLIPELEKRKQYLESLLKETKRQLVNMPEGKLRVRQIIYHEHLGLLDDNKYRKSNLKKLNEYRRNGIYPGKNLIVTHEAEGSYLNINEVRGMVCELFSQFS